MTQAEWDKRAIALNRAISNAEKYAKSDISLADKIAAQRYVKALREEMRLHRLSFHEIVA